MGQTLSHGVYLPNEGERNCYAGLASNWQILNTAVGNIAEKAPLVHTHGNITNDGKVGTTANLPLITGTGGAVQAGSFGNQANTFCEGNDSRLSDARTPVAHTHTKSDVTDLLNSNFIPSANNTYDLGSSSYQWNNVYSKGYYYNGVAWGLDKANEWSNTNIYTNTLSLKHTALEVGVLPASNQTRRYRFADKNNANVGWVQHRVNTSGDSYIEIYSVNRFSDGQYSPQGSDVANALSIGLHSDGKKYAQIASDFFPANTNLNCNLGTSTNKWKTLNGVNPGALSLPSGVRQSISEYITNVNLSWDNQITAVRDGYVVVTINDAAGNSIYLFNNTKQYSNGSYGNGSQGTGRLTCMLPVNEGDVIYIFIKAAALSDVFSAYLYVMNGNVNALPSS